MPSYLDYMSKGMQSAYGGGYSQLYRKPQYTQIGQTKMTQPTRIGLDNIYGQAPQALPQLASAPTFTMQPGEGTITQGQYGDYEQYIEASDDWEQQVDRHGNPHWFPTNAQNGQQYEDAGGKTWVHWNGTWLDTWVNPDTGQREFTSADSDGEQSFIAGQEALEPNLTGEHLSWLEDKVAWIQENMDIGDTWGEEKIMVLMSDGTQKQMTMKEALVEYGNQIEAEKEKLLGQKTMPEIAAQYATLTNYQENMASIFDELNSGDLSYIDDNGMLDTTALRERGAMGNWLADMLEESYKTGDVAGDFFELDEEGNLVLAPEFQAMMDWFDGVDDTTRKQYEDYNRALARHSIASGHSINSGYYSEAFANTVATRAMQVTEQFTDQMMNEMEDQYNYIAKSMEDMLRDMGQDTEADLMAQQVHDNWTAMQEEMRQQAELLAQQLAETEASKRGSIFSAIFTAIIMAVMVAL